MVKKVFKIVGIAVLAIVVIVIGYLLYVILSYKRIPDNQSEITEEIASDNKALTGKIYTVATQNCGFGAYSPEFTFFMDGGKESRGRSKEEVISNIDKAAETLMSYNPDFIFLQEVDTDSDRSYHVNQKEQLVGFFPGFCNVFTYNYRSAYLMFPPTDPHGASESGLLTLSRIGITSSLRRSIKVSDGFGKYLDLDRCYCVSRIPVENGKELVLYNLHTSAYGGSDEVRTSQITQILQDMLSEFKKGNYCVCGGDFNHDFTGDSTLIFNNSSDSEYDWAMPFPEELIPEGLSRCIKYEDGNMVATCRNCDVPYGPDCKVFIVDGFIVSDNVSVESVRNIDADFAYSDHNPVVMSFSLKDE